MNRALLRLVSQAAWLFAVAGLATSAVYVVLALAPGAPEDLPGIGTWGLGVLGGHLGTSSRYRVGADVSALVANAASASAIVVSLALLIALGGAAVLAGIWSSRRRSMVAMGTRGLVYLVSASPAFLLAYWLLVAVNGTVAQGVQSGWWDRPAWFPVPLAAGSVSYGLAAVVLAVGSGVLMETARGLTAELDRLLKADFVLFARAAGRPLWRHLVPSLVGPVASLAVNRLIAIFGGAVIVEVIFNVPGLGRLTWDAALLRDAQVLLGATVVWAVLFAFARLLAEALVIFVDPRRRRSQEAR